MEPHNDLDSGLTALLTILITTVVTLLSSVLNCANKKTTDPKAAARTASNDSQTTASSTSSKEIPTGTEQKKSSKSDGPTGDKTKTTQNETKNPTQKSKSPKKTKTKTTTNNTQESKTSIFPDYPQKQTPSAAIIKAPAKPGEGTKEAQIARGRVAGVYDPNYDSLAGIHTNQLEENTEVTERKKSKGPADVTQVERSEKSAQSAQVTGPTQNSHK